MRPKFRDKPQWFLDFSLLAKPSKCVLCIQTGYSVPYMNCKRLL